MKTTIVFFCIAISYLRWGEKGKEECGYDIGGVARNKIRLATE